jgi:Ca2+-transporting ATPase
MTERSIARDRVQGLRGGEGLTHTEAASRLLRYGRNDVVDAAPRRSWQALIDSARDPMLWFLAVVSALFFATGDHAEAWVLLAAMAPLLGMDAYLHRRTQASTAGLAQRLASQAMVLRDGIWQTQPAHSLVPGDLVRLSPGEYCPADGVLSAGDELQLDESSLSGESTPVRKEALTAELADCARADARHWVIAGTRVLAGSGELRVLHTGAETRYGEIARLAQSLPQRRTPLQLAVAGLVRALLIGALALCVLLFAVRLWQGRGLLDALLSALTLAIAALPEEFPVVLTLFLGVGVFRLARRQALVRRAVAVENIGRVSVLCTDKTGTLTEGRLALAEVLPAPGFEREALLARVNAALTPDSTDPLDQALRAASEPDAAVRVLARFPFAESRRRETVVLAGADGGPDTALSKGAVETILALCALSEATRSGWQQQAGQLAAQGLKVIACAAAQLSVGHDATKEPAAGFEMLGLLAFADPLREGVREAVQACLQEGIRVVMITGDHPATAAAIARAIGLGGAQPQVLSLQDSDRPEPRALAAADVIARALPQQKLALVQQLQAGGEVVAVTGDGVNDVPALQAADIGVAMGERGTQAAREAGDIVLLDDNFATLVSAVGEGRQLFRNLQASFAYLLMIHLPFVLTATLVPALGGPLLYLPIHIVWLELVIHPTAMLAFQQRADGYQQRRGVSLPPGQLFSARAWRGLLLIGALASAAVLLAASLGGSLGDGAQPALQRSLGLAALLGFSASLSCALTGFRSGTAALISALTLVSLVCAQLPAVGVLLQTVTLPAVAGSAAVLLGIGCGLLALPLRTQLSVGRARAQLGSAE